MSFKKVTAKTNINTGPITQFNNSETPSTFLFWKTSPIFSYFTFANGGNIIRINPMASGTFTPPLLVFDFKTVSGKKYPIPTPIAMAKNIHKVKYRSKNDKDFFSSPTFTQAGCNSFITKSLQ